MCVPALLWSEELISLCSETNLDDVLQISNVFVNVSKGEVAKTKDLQKVFGKTDVNDVVKEILAKGEVQVGDKERDHDLTSLRKEIATMVAEKSVDPSTQIPYPVGMIEKAMTEAGYSVKPNKTAKSQVSYTHYNYYIPDNRRLDYCRRSRNASKSSKLSQNSPSNVPVCVFALPCPQNIVRSFATASLQVQSQ